MKVDRWSPSKNRMFAFCGMQYHFRYNENLIIPPDIYQVRGRVTHKGVEENMVAKMVTGEPLSVEAVTDATSDAFEAELQGEVTLSEEYAELGWEKARGQAKDSAIGLALVHHDKVAPDITPTAVEVKIELDPSDALPATMVGVIDLIDDDFIIRDTKTRRKAPEIWLAEQSEQLTFYELAYRALYGKPSGGVALDVLWETPKQKQRKSVTLKSKRRTDDLENAVARARANILAAEKEVYLPASSESPMCSGRWCGYHPDNGGPCIYGRRTKRPTS